MRNIDYSTIQGLRFTPEFFEFANKYSRRYRKIRRKTVKEMSDYKQDIEGGLNKGLVSDKQYIKENEYSARIFDKYILFVVNLPIDRWLEINGDVIFNNGNVYKKCRIAAKTVQELLDRFKLDTSDIEIVDSELVIL